MIKIKKPGVFLLGFVTVLSLAVFLWQSEASFSSEIKENVFQKKDFAEAQNLAGHWVRPDGGYRLVIEDVKPNGNLNASYFNPNKINVSISNWKVEDNRIHLLIELRDKNYPGSKYNLAYISEQNALIGTYFLAVTKETYSIKFLRIPEDKINRTNGE